MPTPSYVPGQVNQNTPGAQFAYGQWYVPSGPGVNQPTTPTTPTTVTPTSPLPSYGSLNLPALPTFTSSVPFSTMSDFESKLTLQQQQIQQQIDASRAQRSAEIENQFGAKITEAKDYQQNQDTASRGRFGTKRRLSTAAEAYIGEQYSRIQKSINDLEGAKATALTQLDTELAAQYDAKIKDARDFEFSLMQYQNTLAQNELDNFAKMLGLQVDLGNYARAGEQTVYDRTRDEEEDKRYYADKEEERRRYEEDKAAGKIANENELRQKGYEYVSSPTALPDIAAKAKALGLDPEALILRQLGPDGKERIYFDKGYYDKAVAAKKKPGSTEAKITWDMVKYYNLDPSLIGQPVSSVPKDLHVTPLTTSQKEQGALDTINEFKDRQDISDDTLIRGIMEDYGLTYDQAQKLVDDNR